MDFYNDTFFRISVFGRDILITETIVGTWAVGLVLIVFALIVRISLNKFESVPRGFQNFIEFIVDTMDKFCTSVMGKKYSYFGAYFFGVFTFIFSLNISGLIGLRPPTADLVATMPLALSTFVLIHFMGITQAKGKYFKSYLEPMFLFLPINIVSALAIPLSMTFRLFGNILGGVIIMELVYSLFNPLLLVGIPAVMHLYFDVFSGALQAFIFVILSMTFIKSQIGETE